MTIYGVEQVCKAIDELVFELFNGEEEQLSKIVRDEMMNAVKFNVPLEVEIGIGENWLEAH